MDVIYWLVPISIFVLFLAIAIFFWAVKNDQYKDLDSPAVDILFDDDSPGQGLNKSNKKKASSENIGKQGSPES